MKNEEKKTEWKIEMERVKEKKIQIDDRKSNKRKTNTNFKLLDNKIQIYHLNDKLCELY